MKDLFLWVILPLILAEALLVGPWIAERLLRWGTRWLPEEYRERYVADWVGELDAVPGSLFKLGFALRVLLTVPATERALTGRDGLWVLIAKRLLALATTGLLMVLMALLRVGKQTRSNPDRIPAFVLTVKLQVRPHRRRSRARQQLPTWTGGSDEALLSPPPPIIKGDRDQAVSVWDVKPNENRSQVRRRVTNFGPIRDFDGMPLHLGTPSREWSESIYLGPRASSADPAVDSGEKPSS
jgi:hypothetical protein